jgi:hypothetical protein
LFPQIYLPAYGFVSTAGSDFSGNGKGYTRGKAVYILLPMPAAVQLFRGNKCDLQMEKDGAQRGN